jgi:glycosyltransferase involved in cell wall biosynthesis
LHRISVDTEEQIIIPNNLVGTMPRVALLRSRFPDVRLEKEARALTKGGFKAEIIAWDRKRGSPSAKKDEGIEVTTLELAAPPSSVLVPLLLPVWMCYAFVRLFRSEVDTVHAADFDACLPALLAAKIKNVPVVYDIYDLYSETMDFPLLKNGLRSIIRSIDDRLMERAKVIVLPDESRLRQIGERVLNLSSHEDHDFVLFFGGEVTPDRCLHLAIEAVLGLSGVKLKIVGPASAEYAAQLNSLAAKTTNVELELSWHLPDFIMKCVRESDALFAIYDPSVPNNRYSSPNKLFEAMMCQKPIIVNSGTSMDKIVQEERCGIVIETLAVSAFREAVLRLKEDARLRETLGKNGRIAYEERYSWSIMERRLIEAHRHLLL